MQGQSWIALLERIPVKYHDTLALTLVTGAEVIMQSVLRLEADYAIIRGRIAGSTDAGRVIVLPYDQVVNLAFTKRMLDPEVQSVFGAGGSTFAEAVEVSATPNDSTAEGDGEEQSSSPENNSVATAAEAPGKGPSAPPSKSMLLARLRARLAEQGK